MGLERGVARDRTRGIPRNVWAASATSFLMDVSSEMVVHLVPLFLAGVLGVRSSVIGLIEGVAASAASFLRLASGWLSDRLGRRKALAVAGYGISAVAKPLLAVARSWGAVAAARWADRLGKGIRTAPRDALLADSVGRGRRGLAFGLHRAADSAGALVGVLFALGAAWWMQGGEGALQARTFRWIALASVVPAALAVLVLAAFAREVRGGGAGVEAPRFRGLGRPFLRLLAILGLFELGNSADAFLVLRARSLGAGVLPILGMLAVFNLAYAAVSAPAGAISDRVPRKRVLLAAWLAYAAIYLGMALAGGAAALWLLFAAYGAYHGAAGGTARALVADVVPRDRRGMAYGAYSFVLGAASLPASLLAGVLWDLLGPRAPFIAGAALAAAAAAGLAVWRPLGPGAPSSRRRPGARRTA